MKLGRNHYRALAVLIVSVHVALLGWSCVAHFPTIDEVGHFPAGISHWKYGNFRLYHVNPPLVRMAATLPVALVEFPEISWDSFNSRARARPEFSMGVEFLHENDFRALWQFWLARFAVVPLSALGACACYALSGKFYGPAAALVGLSLWCFCPTVLAYGACITPDVGAAAGGILAWVLFLNWLRTPTVPSVILFGLALGIAQLTKTSWLALFLLCPLLYVINWLAHERSNVRGLARGAVHLTIAFAVAFYTMNLGYGFERSLTPLGEFEFISRSLTGVDAKSGTKDWTGNRFSDSWLAGIPVPLPANYVLGIDHVKWEFERGYASYLRGEWRHGGWWYYYLYAMLVKLPVGTLLLVASAIVVFGFKCWRSPKDGWNDVLILAPAVAILFLVSSQTGYNHHVRYVLPALPFMYVWVSQLANYVRRDRPLPSFAILAALDVGHRVEFVDLSPFDELFNEFAGGPLNGNEHLHNSNVDWGH